MWWGPSRLAGWAAASWMASTLPNQQGPTADWPEVAPETDFLDQELTVGSDPAVPSRGSIAAAAADAAAAVVVGAAAAAAAAEAGPARMLVGVERLAQTGAAFRWRQMLDLLRERPSLSD